MSILSTLDSLILRQTSNPPLTTKGSELTFAEWDARTIGFYDAVQSIVTGDNVTAYDAGATYDQYDPDIRNRYASYNSRIWMATYNGSPSSFSGQTPAEGVYWTQVTLAQMMPNILELARFAENLSASLNPCPVYCARLDITSAEVLALNSTPLQIVAAPGAGYAIEVISATVNIDYNTTPYATNTTITLITDGADIYQVAADILGADVSKIALLRGITDPTASQTVIIENAALMVSSVAGDPTAGDSDISVTVTYRITAA